MVGRPLPSEYPEYYHQYVAKVTGNDALNALAMQVGEVAELFDELDEDRSLYRYADGKWSIREVLGHIVDGERIFGMRAACIARGETQALPGYDQDVYVANARFDERSTASLLGEWYSLRNANIIMFGSFDAAACERVGIANGKPVSCRALAWIIAGHLTHHLNILHERYDLG